MAYSVWPAELPLPLRGGFRVSGKAPVSRIKMSSGADRVFRGSGTVVRSVPCNVVVPEYLEDVFWRFYDVDGDAGAAWVLVLLKVGNVLALHRCRFVGYPSSVMVSPTAKEFTFTLETDQQIVVPGSLLEGYKMSRYTLPATSIAAGQTYRLEVGDESLAEAERVALPVSYAKVHQVTVQAGSVRLLAAVSDGQLIEYVTINADDPEPTVPLFMAGITRLHLVAQADAVVQVVGY